MRADICNANDEAAIDRFRAAVARLGARTVERHYSALGVDLERLAIGGDELLVFSDAWSMDVEGIEPLVRRVLDECARNPE